MLGVCMAGDDSVITSLYIDGIKKLHMPTYNYFYGTIDSSMQKTLGIFCLLFDFIIVNKIIVLLLHWNATNSTALKLKKLGGKFINHLLLKKQKSGLLKE